MSSNNEFSAFTNLVSVLPKDFLEKNPKLVVGGLLALYVLPHVERGLKYLTDKCASCYCFKVAAQNQMHPSFPKVTDNILVLDEHTIV